MNVNQIFAANRVRDILALLWRRELTLLDRGVPVDDPLLKDIDLIRNRIWSMSWADLNLVEVWVLSGGPEVPFFEQALAEARVEDSNANLGALGASERDQATERRQ